jgi:membrane-associated phospholipid phosphatase
LDVTPTRAAAVAAIVVPPVLLAIYLLAGRLASGREVALPPPLHFGWEDGIPLVLWAVVPYLSLDALIIAVFFLCEDRREVAAVACRLLLAALIAGGLFVLWPMRTAFQYRYAIRYPWQESALYYACEALWKADPYYNRFPSLHVAIAVILWPVFARSVRTLAARVTVHAWFIAVILSTLFTWRHHVADVIAGAALGMLVSMTVSRRFFSRRNSSSAPGPNSQSAAVQPNAMPVHVPR